MISAEQKAKRQTLRVLIRSLAPAGGPPMRHALLAYALLRGRPYRHIEATVRQGHEPSPSKIADILGDEPSWTGSALFINSPPCGPIDYVKLWLADPAAPKVTVRSLAAAMRREQWVGPQPYLGQRRAPWWKRAVDWVLGP